MRGECTAEVPRVDDAGTAQSCTPGAIECQGGAGGHPYICDASGVTRIQMATCAGTEFCANGACTADVCPQGMLFCEDANVRRCSDSGDGHALSMSCGDGTFCDAGQCVPGVCAASTTYCKGGSTGHPFTCDATGSAETQSATCTAEQTCTAGACIEQPSNTCEDGDPFDPSTLRQHVSFLASDALGGRDPGTPGDVQARQFMADKFRCLDRFLPGGPDGSYQQTFTNDFGVSTANVLAYIPGTDLASEIIVIGAHHDHLGTQANGILNGANDNASGTVAVLALAEAIQRRGIAPRRTLVFVLFGSEENFLEGSYRYVAAPPEGLPISQVVYMVNLDIVGGNPERYLEVYGSFGGTQGRTSVEAVMAPFTDFEIYLGGGAGRVSSDFDPFCDLGIPYLFFETWDETCYHLPCDEAERLDYDMMSRVTQLALDVLTDLADTDADLALERAQTGCDD